MKKRTLDYFLIEAFSVFHTFLGSDEIEDLAKTETAPDEHF